jgi:hypothetical protein
MNLNSQYLVLFKNPRDQQQVAVLARQMYPNNWRKFLDQFQQATKEPYGYLVVDLKQETPDSDRLLSNILHTKRKDQTCMPQLALDSQPDSITYCASKENMDINQPSHISMQQSDTAIPSCIDCGLLFASPMDIQKHVKRGCAENEDEPLVKRSKYNNHDKAQEIKNDAVWGDMVQEAYNLHDDDYLERVQEYEDEGMTNKKAQRRASDDLHYKYKKSLINIYKKFVLRMHELDNSQYHNDIMVDIHNFMDRNNHDIDSSVRLAIRMNRALFEDILEEHDDDVDSYSSEGESDDDNDDSDSGDSEGASDEDNDDSDSGDSEGASDDDCDESDLDDTEK